MSSRYGGLPLRDPRRAADMAGAATRSAPVEQQARDEPREPAEERGDDDDPDQRRVARADDPADLHAARVGHDQRDEDDEERREQERPSVKPGPAPAKGLVFLGRDRGYCSLLLGIRRKLVHRRKCGRLGGSAEREEPMSAKRQQTLAKLQRELAIKERRARKLEKKQAKAARDAASEAAGRQE